MDHDLHLLHLICCRRKGWASVIDTPAEAFSQHDDNGSIHTSSLQRVIDTGSLHSFRSNVYVFYGHKRVAAPTNGLA